MLTVNGISKESSNLTINGMNPEGISLNGGDIRLDVTGDFFYTLRSWGNNDNGQLGLGDEIHRSSPVQVGSLTTWNKIAGGYYHTVAIKADGTLWSWGRNTEGQLGLEDIAHRSSPVQVGSLTTWNKVTGGRYHTVAIKADGTLWSWGQNSYGQLGLEDVVYRSSPVQVGSLTTWDKIEGGNYATLAIKTNATLWSWGNNSYGQLGLGDQTKRSSPVQVGSLTMWDKVESGREHTVAIKADGTLWSWGRNHIGYLGLEDLTNRSSPVQVGSLTTWDKVAAGRYHTLATKTDGTLWSWGYNQYGELGLGDRTGRSSPVQVGSLTTWDKIVGGRYNHTVAIKTDGTLWSWGYNLEGQLGSGDTARTSSPVQVGSLTTWAKISGGYGYTVAIKTEESTYPLMCFDAGNARFRCEGADLSPFARADNDYILTVKDSVNKAATGLIDLPDTAEALGGELFANWNMESGFTGGLANSWTKYTTNQTFAEENVIVRGAGSSQKITCANDGEDMGLAQAENLTEGKHYKFNVWVYSSNGNNVSLYASNLGGVTSLATSAGAWVQLTKYAVATASGAISVYVYQSSANCTIGDIIYIDEFSFQEVTNVGTDGVLIMSTKGGLTQSWTDIEDGFNYNDSSGYTFEITSVSSDLTINGGD